MLQIISVSPQCEGQLGSVCSKANEERIIDCSKCRAAAVTGFFSSEEIRILRDYLHREVRIFLQKDFSLAFGRLCSC